MPLTATNKPGFPLNWSSRWMVDVYEAMCTLRAIRRLRQDPVPDEILFRLLRAATWAPSSGNRQMWAFIVVRDQEIKRQIALWHAEDFERLANSPAGSFLRAQPLQYASYLHLARNLVSVPVLVVACRILSPGQDPTLYSGASIYPAVQNLMLAARAEGLGSTLTTTVEFRVPEFRSLLQLPDEAVPAAVIPLGWPLGHFSPAKRRPLAEVVYLNRWGCSVPKEM